MHILHAAFASIDFVVNTFQINTAILYIVKHKDPNLFSFPLHTVYLL